ncbi:hypothetical protein NEHOM01_0600 [Nematocida homosporus]|uniref:uncharacterized protein n=1 Tax=Nematocida homosporus TaxID=1912981 RepID=UPI00221F729F|nr:uncharacterized protein NEHOM01_0600 [Nematocida homosporus]KAI5185095.1 hypothetical protein NEHOM01_0600 [Nematocida homosporus]
MSPDKQNLNINRPKRRRVMVTSPDSYFDSFHKTPQGEFKNTYYNPFHVKPRKRTSKEQLEVLEKTFATNIKPDAALRKALADKLGMTPRSVQVWFQNKRAKVKNERQASPKDLSPPPTRAEIEITPSLYAKPPQELSEKTKEDYECFLLNYPGFNQDYECAALPSRPFLEDLPAFKEEDLQSLDKLILGEENSNESGNVKKKPKPSNNPPSNSSYCSFYSLANSLHFDPSNYLN